MPPTLEIDETWRGRSGNANAQSGRKLVRVFEIRTDDPEATTIPMVVNALGTSEGIYMGVAHPDFSTCRCDNIDPKQRDDAPEWFDITVSYTEPRILPGAVFGGAPGSSSGPSGGGESAPQEPQDRPPYYTTDYRKQPVYQTQDLDGNLLVNTADDPLEDVPPINMGIGVINLTRFYEAWSFTLGVYLINSVNLTSWNGLAADTCLIDACPAKPKTEKGRAFWEVNYTILYNPLKWIPTNLLNVGRNEYRLIDGVIAEKKEKITDFWGQEKPGLSLLSPQGNAAIRETVTEGGTTAVKITGFVKTPNYRPFRFYKRYEFSSL